MKPSLRVVLFADSFSEANGVATVSREFTTFAEEHQLAFCCVRAGPVRRSSTQGSVTTLELNRSWASFPLDKDLQCDLLLNRHRNWVIAQLQEFRPDVIHITGPGDFGVLGFWVAAVMKIPLAASWHTNLHEYVCQRLEKTLSFIPLKMRRQIGRFVQSRTLDAVMRFYRLAHVVLAPNEQMLGALSERTKRPAYPIGHGVDTRRFSPALRKRVNGPVSIGYVGRLTPEKNLRWFRDLEQELAAQGQSGFRLVLVGDGSEREWLTRNLHLAELPGVLRGDDLAAAFANMDIFVFPSRTDTFGLVILEAMASGVPVVVTPQTGERVRVRDGVDGFLTEDFTKSVLQLMRDEVLRQGIGAEARRAAHSRDWCTVFQDLYQVYECALQREEVLRRIRKAHGVHV